MKAKYIIVKESFNPNDETTEQLCQKVIDAILDGFVIVSAAGATENNVAQIHYVLVKK